MRSHYCGHVTLDQLDHEVELCGWVNRRRDHGGVIFIDLRDREGLVQIVFEPEDEVPFATAEKVRSEYVLHVTGRVRHRPEGTVNSELPTGAIEVVASSVEVLNSAETPPFQLDEEDVNEESRLRYRYIDLRRPVMLERIRLRARITGLLRRYLDDNGFLDIETPMLTRATPEGARDYLVPSRTHPGKFFALPQSPQLFKQMLMMSGMDRYYQVVRCFRDEDLRADRQPEFTQLDIETSFLDEDQIIGLMEGMMAVVFREVLGVELQQPFARMSYDEAIDRFGTDRPDLRIPLELVDLGDAMAGVEFKVFSGPANDPGGRVAALRVPDGGKLTRKQIDGYTEYVGRYGAKGLAYIKVNAVDQGREGLQSPILKFLPDEVIDTILQRTGAMAGDLIFFGADRARVVNESLAALRVRLGHDLGMAAEGWKLVWVVEFPMFEYDEGAKRWVSLHHPFTAPDTESMEQLQADPGACKSRAYDLVLNGTELGGGSIRIHRTDMQKVVFRLLGIDDEEAADKFGFLLDALKYGCPPHGGIAFGLDRLVMLLTGANSIREVIAFPKTQTASCPLTSAPTEAEKAQLKDLNIRIHQQPRIE